MSLVQTEMSQQIWMDSAVPATDIHGAQRMNLNGFDNACFLLRHY